MIRDQFILDIADELIVDNFAGGGGASTGIELALGRHVDIAINHDPEAVRLHATNHPQTRHLLEDVFAVDPVAVTNGRPVGLGWFSPDCKHFSKAKGGKPRSKKIRGLAWIVVKWAAKVRPRVIMLENVEEFQDWGPLLKNGSPCPKRKGRTFANWCARLRNLGYVLEARELRACDYGAPTIRKRLFVIARCDGRPIIWPEPTHGAPDSPEVKAGKRKPWRTAAECIDWSLPCPSIFLSPEEARKLGVKRPLAPATLRRIAKGIMRYVVNSANPFIVNCAHGERTKAGVKRWGSGTRELAGPLPTVTASNDFALCAPHITKFRTGSTGHRADEPLHTITAGPKEDPAGAPHAMGVVAAVLTECANASQQRSMPADEPLRTICAEVKGGHHALVSAFLAKHYGGHESPGSALQSPVHTITSTDHNGLVAATLTRQFGTSSAADIQKPAPTVMADGGGKTQLVRAFLVKYYGVDQDPRMEEPLHTVTSRDRFGLVQINGQDYAISDIGLRMLAPRELYRAQGFPESYAIGDDLRIGFTLSKSAQVRMCGNSVCPPLAAALVAANVPEMASWWKNERKRKGGAA